LAVKSRTKPLEIGMRVRHTVDKRAAIVVGSPQSDGHRRLVPVNIEASTRSELWPEHLIKVRRKREQFPAHGGKYQPRPGYLLKAK